MIRTTTALALLAILTPTPALAFNQPAVNLASTNFLDGGPVPPGFYLSEYAIFVNGEHAKDHEGRDIPGGASVSAMTWVNQAVYVSPLTVAGGHLGLDLLLPLVTVNARGSLGPVPLTANSGGFGDIIVGPLLQWNGGSLLGRPFLQRFEVDFFLPTGRYDSRFSANPGFNHLTVDSYYAFTWLFAEGWETSARLWYAFHGENDETRVRPGQLFHANLALSRQVHPALRLGASGYVLQQTTEDRVAGVRSSDSKERAFAVGPGLVYQNPAFLLQLTVPIEFGVRNRFQGNRATLQLIHRF